MAEQDKIEYEFEDLRRNDDELPPHILAQFGEAPSDLDETTAAASRMDDPDDEGGGEGGEEDDDREMIPRSEVEKRMARIRREANSNLKKAREEAEQTITKLQKRVDEIESSGEQEKLDSEYQKKLDDLNEQIDSAVEEGDNKKVAQLTAEMSKLTAERVTKQEELKRKRASEKHDDPDDLDDPEQRKPTIIPRARDWLAEQQHWWDDPEHAHIKNYVNKLDRVLQERGYDPNEDDFYEQLEEKVEKKFPGVIVRTMDGEGGDDPDDEFADIPDKRTQQRRRQRQAARRAPTGDRTGKAGGQGGQGGQGSGKGGRGGKGKTLSRSQIANMRMFGMDPSNKEHVEAYLNEVQ